jgi:hypothetical protein
VCCARGADMPELILMTLIVIWIFARWFRGERS